MKMVVVKGVFKIFCLLTTFWLYNLQTRSVTRKSRELIADLVADDLFDRIMFAPLKVGFHYPS